MTAMLPGGLPAWPQRCRGDDRPPELRTGMYPHLPGMHQGTGVRRGRGL